MDNDGISTKIRRENLMQSKRVMGDREREATRENEAEREKNVRNHI